MKDFKKAEEYYKLAINADSGSPHRHTDIANSREKSRESLSTLIYVRAASPGFGNHELTWLAVLPLFVLSWMFAAYSPPQTNANIGASETAISGVGQYPYGVIFDPSNNNLYVTAVQSGLVSVIDPTRNTVVDSVKVGLVPKGLAYDPANGNVYVVNQFSNTVSVINATSNELIGNIKVGPQPIAVEYDPSNKNLYVTNSQSSTLSVINGSTNEVVANITAGLGMPIGMAMTL
jgi:YVTN family beta-propeller protein